MNWVHRLYRGLRKLFQCSFFRWDHLAVCLMVAIFGVIFELVILKLSIFDVVAQAFKDFSMTDMYFEMHRSDNIAYDDDIVIVDMTEVSARDTIAQALVDIKSCRPKVLVVDLIFANQNFDPMDDVALVNAIEGGDNLLLSCKLTDYSPSQDVFRSCLRSFFSNSGTYEWAYSNVLQKWAGSCIREMTMYQQLNDTIMYSLPYLAACQYQGKSPQRESMNVRKIMYDDTDFITIKSNEVLQHASLLKDKLVIFGTVHEEADMHITPIGKMPGAKVLAYSALTCLKHGQVKQMSKVGSIVLAFLLCYLIAWADYKIAKRHPVWGVQLIKLLAFLLAALLIWWAFRLFIVYDYHVSLLLPLVTIGVTETIRNWYKAFVIWLGKKTKWKFIRKSIYAGKG